MRKFSYFSQNITWNQADPRGHHTASLAEQVAKVFGQSRGCLRLYLLTKYLNTQSFQNTLTHTLILSLCASDFVGLSVCHSVCLSPPSLPPQPPQNNNNDEKVHYTHYNQQSCTDLSLLVSAIVGYSPTFLRGSVCGIQGCCRTIYGKG